MVDLSEEFIFRYVVEFVHSGTGIEALALHYEKVGFVMNSGDEGMRNNAFKLGIDVTVEFNGYSDYGFPPYVKIRNSMCSVLDVEGRHYA